METILYKTKVKLNRRVKEFLGIHKRHPLFEKIRKKALQKWIQAQDKFFRMNLILKNLIAEALAMLYNVHWACTSRTDLCLDDWDRIENLEDLDTFCLEYAKFKVDSREIPSLREMMEVLIHAPDYDNLKMRVWKTEDRLYDLKNTLLREIIELSRNELNLQNITDKINTFNTENPNKEKSLLALKRSRTILYRQTKIIIKKYRKKKKRIEKLIKLENQKIGEFFEIYNETLERLEHERVLGRELFQSNFNKRKDELENKIKQNLDTIKYLEFQIRTIIDNEFKSSRDSLEEFRPLTERIQVLRDQNLAYKKIIKYYDNILEENGFYNRTV